MSNMNKMILAAEAPYLNLLATQYGHRIGEAFLVSCNAATALHRINDAGLWLGPRGILEKDDAFRQIIPYVVFRWRGELLSYVRSPAGGESRLHAKSSIGFGGHVDAEDCVFIDSSINLDQTLGEAINREVREELGPDLQVIKKQCIGLLVDNKDAVGRVHLGLVALWDLAPVHSIQSNEDEISDVGFQSLEGLRVADDEHGNLENWSSVLVRYFQVMGLPE